MARWPFARVPSLATQFTSERATELHHRFGGKIDHLGIPGGCKCLSVGTGNVMKMIDEWCRGSENERKKNERKNERKKNDQNGVVEVGG